MRRELNLKRKEPPLRPGYSCYSQYGHFQCRNHLASYFTHPPPAFFPYLGFPNISPGAFAEQVYTLAGFSRAVSFLFRIAFFSSAPG